jgi:DNA-binding winged helix-turn-helix (wHTH) protein/Tol biopolymer transport system component
MPDSTTLPRLIRFGVFEVDLRSGELRKNGLNLRLRGQPFEVLTMLLERPGEIVTREELQRRLWPADTFVDFDHSLNTAVNKIREVLGDSAETPRYVETVPRRGYRFIAPVDALTPSPSPTRERGLRLVGAGEGASLRRWVAAGGLVVVIAAVLVALIKTSERFRRRSRDLGPVRFQIAPPENLNIALDGSQPQATISPDGGTVAFVAQEGGARESGLATSLWVRPLGAPSSRRLEGANGASFPFWSPDSQNIAFFADGKLKRIAVTGGSPLTICDGEGSGGTWGPDGTIVFTREDHAPLFRVPATGGVPTPATELNKTQGHRWHSWPQFFPDGRHFLYFAESVSTGKSGVHVKSLDSPEVHLLLATQTAAAYAPSGFLLFVRDNVLFAQRLDLSRYQLEGEPHQVVENVNNNEAGDAAFSVSTNGVLVYRGGMPAPLVELAWYDRKGRRLGPLGEAGDYWQFALSPDEKRLAVQRFLSTGDVDLWLLEVRTGVFSRLTFGPSWEFDPLWSPDSQRIVYAVGREDGTDLMEMVVGARTPQMIYSDNRSLLLDDWSPDGRFIVGHVFPPGPELEMAVFVLPMQGERKPQYPLRGPFIKDQFHVSPDSQWVVYNTDESGRFEVFISSFPDFHLKRQVSTRGGGEPVWRRDGKELFYLSPEGKLMSVEIRAATSLEIGEPKVLFQSPIKPSYSLNTWLATHNGQKFLFQEPHKGSPGRVEQINVVVNWDANLPR